ncbi:GNAT family N-acetyltransferase [Ruania zhangjianzhongii]|uniref:GNAT family N-acetyltransferase n=1 Tax=Ruania zhangjianzhongii TaxID=2603206 RepID=UPI0011CBF8F0|nr:GNAT family N-acetyltransferase [Ruania zhangjianzhongii]
MPSRARTPDSNNSFVLHTDRLRLDPPERGDAAAVLAIAGDPRAVEHNPSDLISDLAEAEDLVGRWIQHWERHGFGYWCVRETGRTPVVGYCGVKGMLAREQPVLNLIYRFRPEVWGRGYATEAARAAITWAQTSQPGATILARVRPENVASRTVALKAGLSRDPALDEDGEDGLDLAFTDRRRRSTRVAPGKR